MSVSALISNISRGSVHDGPGIRTVIYFKGCLLRCAWCHNPETLSFKKEILFHPSKCVHCGACVAACPEHHVNKGTDISFLREGCAACGRCADVCPSLALSVCGEEKTADLLFAEILKDQAYYAVSGGGVTFSGGECLLHPDIVAQTAQRCKEAGISTAAESALFVPWENVQAVLPYIDLFYADLKVFDSEKHRHFTGQSNEHILENLQMLSHTHSNIIVRIPVIPGVNDTWEDFDGFAKILTSLGSGVRQVELLKYNTLGGSKYDALGKQSVPFADTPQSDEQMQELCTRLNHSCHLPCSY